MPPSRTSTRSPSGGAATSQRPSRGTITGAPGTSCSSVGRVPGGCGRFGSCCATAPPGGRPAPLLSDPPPLLGDAREQILDARAAAAEQRTRALDDPAFDPHPLRDRERARAAWRAQVKLERRLEPLEIEPDRRVGKMK